MSARRRIEKRRLIFGEGAAYRVRPGKDVGWFRAPRTLPYLLQLLREPLIVGRSACDQVYLELLSHDLGDGLVETADEKDHAFAAGYSSARRDRTWRERIELLAQLGFIETQPREGRKHGYILLVDVEPAVRRIEGQHELSEGIRNLLRGFRLRRVDTGVDEGTRFNVGLGVMARIAAELVHQTGLGLPLPFTAQSQMVAVDNGDPRGCRELWNTMQLFLRQQLPALPPERVQQYVDTLRQRIVVALPEYAQAGWIDGVLTDLVGPTVTSPPAPAHRSD